MSHRSTPSPSAFAAGSGSQRGQILMWLALAVCAAIAIDLTVAWHPAPAMAGTVVLLGIAVLAIRVFGGGAPSMWRDDGANRVRASGVRPVAAHRP
jgi:hypothetical protein